MGQVRFTGKDRERFVERVTVVDFTKLKAGQGSLSLIMNENGGINDDTVVSKYEDHVYMVINAGCKDKDLAHMKKVLDSEFNGKDVQMSYKESEDALIAVQGPKAASIVETIVGVSFKK
jgi:aminomethyltransferase